MQIVILVQIFNPEFDPKVASTILDFLPTTNFTLLYVIMNMNKILSLPHTILIKMFFTFSFCGPDPSITKQFVLHLIIYG